jgi:hypothetical protein
MQQDPLGINPAGGFMNSFSVIKQYSDGLSMYEYVRSNPIVYKDYNGTYTSDLECCKFAEEQGWYGEKTRKVSEDGSTVSMVVGKLICCEGRKVSCTSFGPKGSMPLDVDDVGLMDWYIETKLKECVLKHEDRHRLHTQPCEECGIYPAIAYPDLDAVLAECAAFKQEYDCLKNAEYYCEKTKDPERCKKAIQKRTKVVEMFLKRCREKMVDS